MGSLTEHMLFYASEKYPEEHEYTKYIMEVHSINQYNNKGNFNHS
jgi:secreted Zn-dependent insulinase-like peptidase